MLPRVTAKAEGSLGTKEMASYRSRRWWQAGRPAPYSQRTTTYPLEVTLGGPSIFLPLSCPPLAELLSIQQPQFGKLSSRELGTQFAEQPVAESLGALHSILST